MLDGPEMICAFFGAIKIGAVPVPLNTRWTAAEYEYVLQDSARAGRHCQQSAAIEQIVEAVAALPVGPPRCRRRRRDGEAPGDPIRDARRRRRPRS